MASKKPDNTTRKSLKIYSSTSRESTGSPPRKRLFQLNTSDDAAERVGRTARIRRRRIIFMSIAVILVAALTFITHIETHVIDGLDSSGVSSEVQESADSYLRQHPFARFQFLISIEDLESYLKEQHPSIESIEIQRSLFSRAVVANVSTYPAAILWQQGREGEPSVLDTSGHITHADKSKYPDLPRVVNERAALDTREAQLDAATITVIQLWHKKLAEKGMNLDFARLTTAPREVTLHIKDKPYVVRVSTEETVEQGVAALEQTLAVTSPEPKEYVDIRIPYRVFTR